MKGTEYAYAKTFVLRPKESSAKISVLVNSEGALSLILNAQSCGSMFYCTPGIASALADAIKDAAAISKNINSFPGAFGYIADGQTWVEFSPMRDAPKYRITAKDARALSAALNVAAEDIED